MIPSIILILLAGLSCYYFLIHPDQKIKRIKSNVVLEVDGANTRYSNLPLGNVGIFSEVNEKRRIRVIFPKLTAEGNVEYIYSWHSLESIRIPSSKRADLGGIDLKIAQELAVPIKEHVQFVEPEILHLREQWHKINELLDLVATSELYASQHDTYERALHQVENLLEKAEELQRVYIRLIREMLIGRQVSGYNPNLLPDDSLALDRQYKNIRDDYQQMKDTATAYTELLRTRRV